ncbi:MAG: 2-oxoacid:ferredoxin oxidoreductase subunit beta [bacterium]|nr:2-oxoacid:ferredoxin oxidoreductase subunit beta [bacterium]
MQSHEIDVKYTPKDFDSGEEPRWCPGCGDYAILNAVRQAFSQMGIPKEKFVIVSGIGCSSRFPYYMNTYGFHGIHGRAPAIATGVKVANPDLSVWVVTGDGDGLAIGGNHLMHAIRRNVDIKILLFDNRIYGLTKGQYSPTSIVGQETKSSPYGVIERPMDPVILALSQRATFVAKVIDTDIKRQIDIFKEAAKHKGTAFVQIYQNCVVFNDGAFEDFAGKEVRSERLIELKHGQPMIFGKNLDKGIIVKDLKPQVVKIGENGITKDDITIYDETNYMLNLLVANLHYPEFPETIGIIRRVREPTYEELLYDQIETAKKKRGEGNIKRLIQANSWEVSPS